ncbi:MAG: hypothetical protein AAF502_17380 [Bacteroidota bacterium]
MRWPHFLICFSILAFLVGCNDQRKYKRFNAIKAHDELAILIKGNDKAFDIPKSILAALKQDVAKKLKAADAIPDADTIVLYNDEWATVETYVGILEEEKRALLRAESSDLNIEATFPYQYLNDYLIGASPGIDHYQRVFVDHNQNIIFIESRGGNGSDGPIKEIHYFKNDKLVYSRRSNDIPARTGWETIDHKIEEFFFYFKDDKLVNYSSHSSDYTNRLSRTSSKSSHKYRDRLSKNLVSNAYYLKGIYEYILIKNYIES